MRLRVADATSQHPASAPSHAPWLCSPSHAPSLSNSLPQVLLHCVHPVPLQGQQIHRGHMDLPADSASTKHPRSPSRETGGAPPQGQHKPFSKVVAIPQDFLSPVSGMCPSATRRARGTVANLAAGSQLRVPMVNVVSCGFLCPATLVPQARHCPQSSQLSRCWQKPGLTTPSPPHRRPLVP